MNDQSQFTDSPLDEILQSIFAANFSRAVKVASDWLKTIPLDNTDSFEHHQAREAFILGRYFLHRQDRLTRMTPGADKAREYIAILADIADLRNESGLSQVLGSQSDVLKSIEYHIHSRIAEGLAKDFAGQKSYHLDKSEILQLAVSLIEIENFKSAGEVLDFLIKMQSRTSIASFLMAYVCYRKGDEECFSVNLREALFQQPEVLGDYLRYLPGGVYYDVWEQIDGSDHTDILKYRYYALMLEVNGLYRFKRKLTQKELEKIEIDFEKLYREFKNSAGLYEELAPRVMHFLTWLVYNCHQNKDFDRLQDYRSMFIDIDKEIWETFQKKNLDE